MPRAVALALLASVALTLPHLGSSAFDSWRPLADGSAFLTGCDTNAVSFMSEFCDELDLDSVCQNLGGRSLFFLDASSCVRAALALNQAARMINEDTPADMCIEARGFSGETLAFAAELAASAPDAAAALNDAANGVSGYTASDVSCAAPTTTASPSPEPTDGPTESAPPTRSPATSPTASPAQLCHGDADLGICDM